MALSVNFGEQNEQKHCCYNSMKKINHTPMLFEDLVALLEENVGRGKPPSVLKNNTSPEENSHKNTDTQKIVRNLLLHSAAF
jgi:hypothetical protein